LFAQLSAIVAGLHSVMSAVTGGARMENIWTERESLWQRKRANERNRMKYWEQGVVVSETIGEHWV